MVRCTARDKRIISSTHEQAPSPKKIPEEGKSTWPHASSSIPSHALNSLFVEQHQTHRDPPRPPLSTHSCSSKHLPYTWLRAKQNERGCPNRRWEIFFWEKRTSKTRRVNLSGLLELKIVTSVNVFGVGPFVVAKLWILMANHDVIPPEGKIKHLLWTLHFLKAYPRQATVCSMVGGSTGAVDPKTLRKYMWPFIRAIADFEPALVSIN